MGGTVTRSAFETLARAFEHNPVFSHLHPYDLYRAWLEAVWAFLDAVHDPAGYRQCLDRYTHEQGAEFGRLLGLYVDAVEEQPFYDILGDIFMRLDVNSVKAGQFFTPWSVAEMMARMQFCRDDFERTVQEKGVVTVCDPVSASSSVPDGWYRRTGLNTLSAHFPSSVRSTMRFCGWLLRSSVSTNG